MLEKVDLKFPLVKIQMSHPFKFSNITLNSSLLKSQVISFQLVRDPPAVPQLKVLQLGEKGMNVSILPAEGDNTATHFYVEYRLYHGSSTNSWRRSRKIETTGTKPVQLRNLDPGTMYTVSSCYKQVSPQVLAPELAR